MIVIPLIDYFHKRPTVGLMDETLQTLKQTHGYLLVEAWQAELAVPSVNKEVLLTLRNIASQIVIFAKNEGAPEDSNRVTKSDMALLALTRYMGDLERQDIDVSQSLLKNSETFRFADERRLRN